MKRAQSDDPVLEFAVSELVQRLDPESIVLFGSRARGDASERSDYDIAVTSPRSDKAAWALASLFIREHNPSLYTIDLVNTGEASPSLLKKVTEEGISLYQKKGTE